MLQFKNGWWTAAFVILMCFLVAEFIQPTRTQPSKAGSSDVAGANGGVGVVGKPMPEKLTRSSTADAQQRVLENAAAFERAEARERQRRLAIIEASNRDFQMLEQQLTLEAIERELHQLNNP